MVRMKESFLAAALTSSGRFCLGRASMSVCKYMHVCMHARTTLQQLNRGYFI